LCVTRAINDVVEDSVQQQFNDSIRDMHEGSVEDEVKETLKFHRDAGKGSATEELEPPTAVLRLVDAGTVALCYLLRTSSRV
jgi:hypothetical protein